MVASESRLMLHMHFTVVRRSIGVVYKDLLHHLRVHMVMSLREKFATLIISTTYQKQTMLVLRVNDEVVQV
jgi:hypothetical protein